MPSSKVSRHPFSTESVFLLASDSVNVFIDLEEISCINSLNRVKEKWDILKPGRGSTEWNSRPGISGMLLRHPLSSVAINPAANGAKIEAEIKEYGICKKNSFD